MPDFNIRSDSVNVEQIMEQIRARIREKRGVDYTQEQISELAAVKLETFLDPRGLRSDLLEQYRRTPPPPARPNYAFGEDTLFETHRGPIRWIRTLLRPLLKLFFNPNPLIQALHIQSQLNETNARRESDRYALDQINFELVHNMVMELTRLGIEVKNVKMRAESLASRLEFNERRARALESVVAYRPEEERESAAAQSQPLAPQFQPPQVPRPQVPRPQIQRPQIQRPQVPRPQIQRPPAAAPVPASDREPQTPPEPGQVQPAAEPGAETLGAPEPGAGEVGAAPSGTAGPGQRSRRRRRRRGRRGGGPATEVMGPAVAETAGRESESPTPDSGPSSNDAPDDDGQ